MALIGMEGSSANKVLLRIAGHYTPSLIIDCANVANPHSLFPGISQENMHRIYVIELELIYKFRDVLKRVPSIARRLEIGCIVVTCFTHLFHYQDEEENRDIYEHAWELMRRIGEQYPTIVGIAENQMMNARKYCHRIIRCKNGTYGIKPTYDGRYHH